MLDLLNKFAGKTCSISALFFPSLSGAADRARQPGDADDHRLGGDSGRLRVVARLGLFTLNWILDNFLELDHLVIIVIFQSDIRRALTQVGTAPLFTAPERWSSATKISSTKSPKRAIARRQACRRLGGFQRDVGLSEFMEIGTRLDARVSRELLESVFLPNSPIHDGALVIQKNRGDRGTLFVAAQHQPASYANPGARAIAPPLASPKRPMPSPW